ncbi:MAG: GMP synthase [Gammaproteobacteria bacterium]|nr:GMP synthase [Gammaproteobacteria bacterium]|tara:strand:+ start:721 stop:1443 length:723 start_codon:yes stop_codon:yes gene_type:complete
MKPILIIKTGVTVKTAYVQEGDFERWIIDTMQGEDENFSVVEVFRDEKLPLHDSVAGVVVTGSPAMVTDKLDWSEYTADWLRHALVTRLPILGICYGHQLLAHALGGEVDFHPKGREIGTTRVSLLENSSEDSLFSGSESPFLVHVSHMQSVVRLPAGAEVLGSNEFEAYHAVRFAENVWGLQFHPEFSETAMRAYISERQETLQEEGLDVEELLKQISPTPVAEKLMHRFHTLIKDHSV